MKFSIVTATFNRSRSLDRLVQSVIAQRYTDFEFIVVDDGSTDDTASIMQRYAKEFERIKYMKLDKNHGSATPARNHGIDAMSGDALIIWDSDDVLHPNALSVLAEGFKRNPTVGVVCTSTDFYRGKVKQKLSRIDSCVIKPREWFCGKKPQDAEIMAVKKEYIGNVRFESRGIDFVFYAKIIGGNMIDVYYYNETCGEVYLESDALSLTLARKKRNNELSMQRAPILDDFIAKYGHMYSGGECMSKYAGYAFGASVGYVIAGDYRRARFLLRMATANNKNISWFGLYLLLHIPGGGHFASFLLS
jgi:glycosyltransferase involved in cell wall biosynthesis